MGRSPCCDDDANVKKGPWTPEEDNKLMEYIVKHGCGNWRNLPKGAGPNRCGKSCRLRWANYLRPDIKRGKFSEEEERLIVHLHSILGNKWSAIAARLEGRTDNEIKNYWNTHLRKKLLTMGLDPVTHRPRTDLNLLTSLSLPNIIAATSNVNNLATDPLINNALQLQKLQLLQTLIQAIATTTSPLSVDPFAHSGSWNPSFQLNSMRMNVPNIDNYDHLVVPVMDSIPSLVTTATNSTDNCLVSHSQENSTVDQGQGPVNTKIDASASSSPTSTRQPFDQDWGGVTLDDLDIDLGWKDILDQMSW